MPSVRRRPIHAPAAVLALALAAALAPAVHAAPQLLDDHEMRDVWGQAGNAVHFSAPAALPALGGLPGTSGGGNDPGSQLASALLQGAAVSGLDAAQFRAAWKAATGSDTPPAIYDGQPVTQIQLEAQPVTIRFDVDALFSAMAGGAPYNGPSGGTITLRDVDARGTTLWIWNH